MVNRKIITETLKIVFNANEKQIALFKANYERLNMQTIARTEKIKKELMDKVLRK